MLRRLAKEYSLRGQALEKAYILKEACSQGWEPAFTASRFSQSEEAQQTLSNKPTGPKAARAAQAALTQTPVPGFKAVPAMPKFLGLAGAIPFLALAPPIAAGIPFMPADLVANAALLQIGYGASIVSFLGGIHWAMAMAYGSADVQTNNDRYLWSVTPCLMAWPAIILQPGPASLVVGSVLGICYVVDKSFTKRGLLPPWYMALRLPLTVAAVAGMSITLVSSLTNHVPERGPAVLPKEQNAESA